MCLAGTTVDRRHGNRNNYAAQGSRRGSRQTPATRRRAWNIF